MENLKKIIASTKLLFIVTVIYIFTIKETSAQLAMAMNDSYPETTEILRPGYYLIAGVFTNYNNVQKYNNQLSEMGYTPGCGFSIKNKMFYSYLHYSEGCDEIKTKLSEKETKNIPGIWILSLKGTNETRINTTVYSEEKNANILIHDKIIVQPSSKDNTIPLSHNHGHRTHPTHNAETHHFYHLLINLQNDNGEKIPANVKIVKGEEAKHLGIINSHVTSPFSLLKNENQTIQLICEVFGYHKTIYDLNLKDVHMHGSSVRVDADTIKIDLKLEKYHKGDIMTMYNVFFHTNTNIMRHKSNFELQALLHILESNPTLKIKIHGHTNGSSFGAISKIEGSSTNYFSPEDVKGIKGSSKKLSMLRTETIKNFLIANGVKEDRINLKGWGGKKMIYKENSPNADSNMRVEVEFLSE